MVPFAIEEEDFSSLATQPTGRHEPLKLMLDAVIAVITNGEKVLLIQRAPGIHSPAGSL